jgi:hypothetical protein
MGSPGTAFAVETARKAIAGEAIADAARVAAILTGVLQSGI